MQVDQGKNRPKGGKTAGKGKGKDKGKGKGGKAGKKGKAGKGAAKGDPKAGTRDRGAMFDGRDLNKDGKLNKEEFMLLQKDPEQAAKNFVKFDKDLSGDVNREEYVKSGK